MMTASRFYLREKKMKKKEDISTAPLIKLPFYNKIFVFFSNSPFRLLLLIMGAVFVGETTVMIVLSYTPHFPLWTEAIFDSTMLVLLLFPVMFFLIYQPFVRHIDHLKKAEQAVRKSQKRFKQIFEGSPLGIAAYDNDGNLLKSNQSCLNIFGLASNDDMKCLQLFNMPNISDSIKRKIRKGQVVRFEDTFDFKNDVKLGCFKSKKSTALNLDFIISPLDRDLPGSFSGYLMQIHDITEKKILERQLMQSEKLASLGFLISGVAHEINNPNNFISFNIPILRDYMNEFIPILDEYQKDHPDIEVCGMTYDEFKKDIYNLVGNIEHGSSRINLIVTSLKEFVRSQKKIDLVDVDLSQVISKAVSICRSKIDSMVQSFTVEVPQNLPTIKTDPRIVEQVLVNLLINAAQSVEKEGSMVNLNIDAGGSLSGHLKIEVSDNGRGIDEETKKKIFDPFFTTKSPGEGTGLGLSICHNLAEQIGARIEVRSKPKRGSTFSIILNKEPTEI
jgi:PAS domain S-box-containing protein